MMATASSSHCRRCGYHDSDVRLLGCGCTLHARCTPLSLVLDMRNAGKPAYGAFPPPNTMKSNLCPFCKAAPVEGISILPLSFEGLERADQLRRRAAGGENTLGKKNNVKDEESSTTFTGSSFLLLTTNRTSCLSSGAEREQQRTGRWTEEEMEYVDYLVMAFDQGQLSLPHGIKLNEFLGDVLICKSSRLTKKMKNAKLSTRSFALGNIPTNAQHIDHQRLSVLEEKFLQSISAEPTQLELRFNMTKQWRTHFSNLCVQVGYPFLDAREWVASLEEMEQRAAQAEDAIRKNRRKRMGLALQTDGGLSASSSIFIGGVQADEVASNDTSLPAITRSETGGRRRVSNSDDGAEEEDADMMSLLESLDNPNEVEATTDEPNPKRARRRSLSQDIFSPNRKDRAYSEDFESVLRDLIEPEATTIPDVEYDLEDTKAPPKKPPNHSCGPFLDAIIMFMENKKLPFQHADVWVPSFLPRESEGPSKAVDTEQLRLFHAGCATRGDLGEDVAERLHEFGVYSDNFSFEPGHGLPGRVYSSGKISWDCNVDETDPKIFERAGGAKVYGVKTAVGIPLSTPLVGRMVVVMYSQYMIAEDMTMAKDCVEELMKYSPEPKWKLVIEMKNVPEKSSALSAPVSQVRNRISPAERNSSQLVGCASTSGTPVATRDEEEQRIVTLLGEHMPLSDGSVGENTSSAATSGNLLKHFVSMRLLMLRPSSKRTGRENEMISVLKNSFRAYAKDNRRGGAELAGLLAKDWVCLQQTFATMNNSSPVQIQPLRRNSSISSMNGGSSLMSSTDNALSRAHALLQGGFNTQQASSGTTNNQPYTRVDIVHPSPGSQYERTSSLSSINSQLPPSNLGQPSIQPTPSYSSTDTSAIQQYHQRFR